MGHPVQCRCVTLYSVDLLLYGDRQTHAEDPNFGSPQGYHSKRGALCHIRKCAAPWHWTRLQVACLSVWQWAFRGQARASECVARPSILHSINEREASVFGSHVYQYSECTLTLSFPSLLKLERWGIVQIYLVSAKKYKRVNDVEVWSGVDSSCGYGTN